MGQKTVATSDYIVSLSEQAFFTVVASSLEAFSVNHGEDGQDSEEEDEDDTPSDDEVGADEDDQSRPRETYGNLWGYKVQTMRGETVLHITMADVDTSARCDDESADPKPQAFRLKQDLIDSLRPELNYLGDFHAHPYHYKHDGVTSALDIERRALHDFSRADFRHARHLAQRRNYQVGLVATVYRGKKHVERKSKYIGENGFSCLRFCCGELTIWLKCYVFEENGERIRDAKVALLCTAIGFHGADIDQERRKR